MQSSMRPVEEAELVVLVDNVSDQARLGAGNVSRQPLFTPGGLVPLLAEHGLSILVRLKVDGRWRSVLLDAGVSGTACVANARALGVDLSEVEAVVVSHGHADHTGGFLVVAGQLTKGIPVIIHPDALRERYFVLPDGTRRPQPRVGADWFAGLEMREAQGPTALLDGALMVTGEVPRVTSFEKGMALQYAVKDGQLVKDALVRDDQAVVFVVQGKGTVVVSGCAHAGIVNTTRHAIGLSGDDRLLAVAGGFHLCWPTTAEAVEQSVQELGKLDPDLLMPIHCTGREAIDRLAQAFPDRFVMGGVGIRLSLP